MSTQQPPTGGKKPAPIVAIKQYVEARSSNLQSSLRGTGLDLQRFLTLAFNQTLQNPELLECTPASWFDALQKAGTHGLYPDGIHAALVPYQGEVKEKLPSGAIEKRRAKMVQFQAMAQGLTQRAYATKIVQSLWSEVVYSGEFFEVHYGSEPKLLHEPKPDRGDFKELIAAYACAKVNGEVLFKVAWPREIARHRGSSKTADKDWSFWNTNTDEAWRKTAIIMLQKTLPHFSAEGQKFAALVEDDQTPTDLVDVSFLPEPSTAPAPMEQAKERLRAAVPDPTVPETNQAQRERVDEIAKQVFGIDPPREPGSDDDEAAGTPPPSHDCFHEPIHGRSVPQGKVVVCPSCKAFVTAVQLRAAEGRYAQAQEGKGR